MNILEKKAILTMEKYKMVEEKDRILVGISGGPDSVALLYFLNSLKEKYKFEIFACHLNHSLRNEAEKEEEFVKEFCKKIGIKIYTKKRDVLKYKNRYKLSLEEACRELRYKFFRNLAERIKATKLALAHTADDNIETVLLFLIRGCGKEGIKGILPVRSEKNFSIIRPFIKIFRTEIEEYLKENNLSYCIDSSNFDKKFLRNKIRYELIPYLIRNYNPKIKEEILKFSEIENEENKFLEEISKKKYENILVEKKEGEVVLKRDKFENLNLSLKRRILRTAIEDVRKNLKDVNFNHIESMIEYIKGNREEKLLLPKDIFLKLEKDKIKISNSNKDSKTKIDYFYKFKIPGTLYLKETNMILKAEILKEKKFYFNDKNVAYFDYEKIGNNFLFVRNRREKDKFSPYGIGKEVKLKSFLINQKIPKKERDLLPLILKDEEIIWVTGVRTSDKFLVEENTKKILEIKLINEEQKRK
jgi:tRNA(Ile)-lysidine synthase